MPKDAAILEGWRPEIPGKEELALAEKIDAADYEVYRRKLELACYESRDTMMKMGVSPMIQGGDMCVGIYSASGDLATAVLGTHMHLIPCQLAIKYSIKYFTNEETVGIRPGDMFYVNDASYGGIHNPDQILYKPVFHDGKLVAWLGAMSHETETGACEPGGCPPSATSRYDEGMRLAPFKVGENNKLRQDLVELMENFVRDPRMQTLDLKARAAACFTVERRVNEVLERKGADFLTGLFRAMIDSSANAARARIASLNDGIYRQPVFLDSVGAGKEGLVRAMVSVHKKGNKCTVDFSGSSPRVVMGNFNSLPHTMIAQCAAFFFQYLFPDLNPSIGVFAPFEFKFEEGSFFDPAPDDAMSLNVATIQSINPAVHNAFEKMLMHSDMHNNVAASWPGTTDVLCFAGVNQYGMPYAAFDQGIANGCGQGAKHDGDGTDVAGFVSCPVGEFLDVEQVEIQYPIINLFRSKYLKNAHGFGKYRGGRTIGALCAFHGVGGFGLPMGGFAKFPVAPGLFGGYAMPPAAAAFVRNSNWKELAATNPEKLPTDIESFAENITGDWITTNTSDSLRELSDGDLFFIATLGGPGYGDVLERDPELVMKDLREDSISHQLAQDLYKVVYDKQALQVNRKATADLRSQERLDRKSRGRKWSEFQVEWSKKKPKEDILKYFGTWPDARPVTATSQLKAA